MYSTRSDCSCFKSWDLDLIYYEAARRARFTKTVKLNFLELIKYLAHVCTCIHTNKEQRVAELRQKQRLCVVIIESISGRIFSDRILTDVYGQRATIEQGLKVLKRATDRPFDSEFLQTDS